MGRDEWLAQNAFRREGNIQMSLVKKVVPRDLIEKKRAGSKITILTAFDAPMAAFIDESGVDAVQVGDSLAMVALGYGSTIQVTMDEMLHHSKAVRRGVKRALLIGDMPFMSYQPSNEDAVRNAGRFLKEAGCEAVKVEGGIEIVPRIKAIVNAGIPVMGHIGLMPQSVNKLGGYRVQGKDDDSGKKITEDALALAEAGCFAVVLECIPASLAKTITGTISIPTIGIGAGRECDGQVLVTHDIIGYFDRFVPKFVKKYTDVGPAIKNAIVQFKEETEKGVFPSKDQSF